MTAKCSGVVLCFFILFNQSSYLQSTVVLEMDIPKMTSRSCSVIVGHVQKIEKQWEPIPHLPNKQIVVATLQVEIIQVIKPCPHFQEGQMISVQRLGGALGGAGTLVPGSPTFKGKTEVLLFLSETSDGKHIITGLSQGKFRIVRNRTTGEGIAYQDKNARNLMLIDPRTGRSAQNRVPGKINLHHLLREIRSHD